MSAERTRFSAHFRHPTRVGPLSEANRAAEAENIACGDWVRFQLCLVGSRVESVRIQVRGCSATIACASLVAEAVEGLELEAARALRVLALAQEAGARPRDLSHAPALVERALEAALAGASAGCQAEV